MPYPVSDRFLAALAQSHTVVFDATIYDPYGQTVLLADLPVVAGQVTVDRTANVRRTCQIDVAVDDIIAAVLPDNTHRSPMDPYGNLLKLQRGIRYADGTTEMCPLGVFRIDESQLIETNSGERHVQIDASDQSKVIAAAKYADNPYTIAAGINTFTAISALVADRMPTAVTVVNTSTAYATPLLVIDGNADPWQAVMQLATSAGAEAFFDVDGTVLVQDVPNPYADPPDWWYADGADCTMTALERDYTTDNLFNGVWVTGENVQDVPVVGSAVDTDPASPTYFYGPFGQRPTSVTDNLALTNGQATTIANGMMRSMLGQTETVQVTIVPNPAIDASDVVHVDRALTGFNDDLLVESFSVPLDVTSEQVLTCRTRRVPPG